MPTAAPYPVSRPDAASPYAPLSTRTAAGVLDIVLFMAALVVLIATVGHTESGGSRMSFSLGWGGTLSLAVAYFAYFFIMESVWQGTIGKLLMGLKIVDEDGRKPSLRAIAARTVLRLIDGQLGSLVAFVAVAASPRNQRIGDMAARTFVVRR